MERVRRAYEFAEAAHGSQKRASGEPYITHPAEVADILADLNLDTDTIITALLHDTVEDTEATVEDVRERFGDRVAYLVDGVTKLSQLELTSEQTKQAENFRKLVLAMARDLRVLLVKLADRLHNMHTLHHMRSEESRRRIAQETMDIYAPLAGLIGMQTFRDDLEDLAFRVLNPEARESIMKRLAYLEKQGTDVVARIIRDLRNALAADGLEAQVSGRMKRPYSIWRKMAQKSVAFEQLSDTMGFRIIVKSVEDCYRALGIVHTNWPMVPERFKDYISTPKRNDYRSIHTTVIGPDKRRIELQIRTEEMEEVAERGLAAHWQYKYANGEDTPLSDSLAYRSLAQFVHVLEKGTTPNEFLENTKLEMFHDQVFCFTPKGELITLPAGATPVDFAYAVHTRIGDTCVGVKINGHHRPLRTRLKNGDLVEIIRSRAQTPMPEWEKFVVTGRARYQIRKFIRQTRRQEFARLGESIARKVFADLDCDFSEKAVKGALKRLKLPSVEDVWVAVGEGELQAIDLVKAVFPGLPVDEKTGRRAPSRKKKRKASETAPIAIRGLVPGIAVHMGQCCHPLPGDRIVGIQASGQGVVVHTIDCETLEQYQNAPELWLDLAWDDVEASGHVPVARIVILLKHEPGALGAVSTIVAKQGGNISNLKITDRNPLFFEMVLDLEVQDVKHLTEIVAALRTNALVESVDRVRGEHDAGRGA
ncbi:MAG: RelA/SpoT family protein [Alphaproteobacteria bacterium]